MSNRSCLLLAGAVGLSLIGLAAPASADNPLTADRLKKVAPEHGLPAVGKFKATWCAHFEPGGYSPDSLGRVIDSGLWDNLHLAIPAACAEPDNPVFQEQVGYYIQLWVNMTGQTPAQIRRFLELRADEDNFKKLGNEACAKLAATDETSDRDKIMLAAEGEELGCWNGALAGRPDYTSYGSQPIAGLLYHLDRDPTAPSQLVLIKRIQTCLPIDAIGPYQLARFALCRADVALLDEKALVAELKAAGLNEWATVMALQAMGSTKVEAGIIEKALQAAVGKDEELKQLLVTAPEAAWKAWNAEYQANKASFDAAYAYEDKLLGGRVSATKGCLDDAQGKLGAYMATITGSSPSEMFGKATTATGMVLIEYAARCNQAEGREIVATAYAKILEGARPHRGPRIAAQLAMGEALGTILADRPKFAVTPVMIGGDFNGFDGTGRGWDRLINDQRPAVVGKVEKKGDLVYVTFKAVKRTVPTYVCKDTDRIDHISITGDVQYQRDCRPDGGTEVLDDTRDPFYTYATLAGGIAVGTAVSYSSHIKRDGKAWEGTPIAVWKKPDQKQLIAVLGFKTK